MTINKVDSNVTGLRYSEEVTLGVADGSAVWKVLEPNSYSDFGGQIKTVARNPINAGRQRKKGVVTDLDASGGFNSDLTQGNLQDLLQGFFFADLRRKGEEPVIAVALDTSNPDEYLVASTTGFKVGDLIKATGFSNSGNNGVRPVTVVTTNTAVKVADGQLTAEGSPPAGANIVVVGHRCASADINVDASGSRPALTSTVLDFTTLGLIVGEWIYVGGDLSANQFVTDANNGFARVRSIAAHRVEFDKTQSTMVTETGTALLIDLYFGRVLKNESDHSLQVRRSYQLERTLGNDDDGEQSEYLEGAIPNQLQFNIKQADKVNVDLTFVATDHEQRSGLDGKKAGTRPALSEADAFNTSSDFSRMKLASVNGANPVPLFAFMTELTVTVNNNVTPSKAVSVLGAFDATAGTFEVGGAITAYFANVAATQAVRNNADVTLDFSLVKDNAGVVVDLPLVSLGDGRLKVEQNNPIMLPLQNEAATGAKIDTNLDHTALMVFFDYLPSLAG